MKTQAEREAGQSTDVLEQAINIVRHVEATGGRISLNLDLDQPGHRAALAAALTVLRAMGEDSRLLLAADGDTPIMAGDLLDAWPAAVRAVRPVAVG